MNTDYGVYFSWQMVHKFDQCIKKIQCSWIISYFGVKLFSDLYLIWQSLPKCAIDITNQISSLLSFLLQK